MTNPTREDVAHLFGSVTDQVAADILEIGASLAELEEVALRINQQDDVLGEMRRPLTGSAARVFDILMSVQDFGDDRDRSRETDE